MTTDKDQYLLKIKDGRLVTARIEMKMILCAVDTQNERENGQRVCIVPNPKPTPKTQMAFFFKRGLAYYLPKVEKGVLTLDRKRSIEEDTLQENHWFEKLDIGNGDHYSLRTVVKPHLYFSSPEDDDPSIFFLSQDDQQRAVVKHEKI